MTFADSLLSLPILFADAPNPASCPHHQCNYHPVTSGGLAVALVVVIVVVVLLVLLAAALLHRRRRRRRAAHAQAQGEVSYLAALGLTLVIEMPVYAGFLRCVLSIGARRGAAVGALVNLASHPIAFLVVMPLLARPLGFFPALVVIEAGVWVAESALLWLWLRRDFDLLGLAALLANTISLTAGLLLIL